MEQLLDRVWHADNRDVLVDYPSDFFDAVVTDFPYGLGSKEPTPDGILRYLSGEGPLDVGGDVFGADWQLPALSTLHQMVRVLKPGGHFMTFAATRTYDVISMSLRMVGLENRDTLMAAVGPPALQWLYAQGVPKNFDLGRVREELKGLGTALKPAWEPVLLFRKPLREDTLAEQYSKTQTGALSIQASKLSSGRYPANVVLVHTPWCRCTGTHWVRTATGRQGGKDGVGKLQDPNGKFGTVNTGVETGFGGEDGMEQVDHWECPEFCPSYQLNRQEANANRYFLNVQERDVPAPFKFVSKATKSKRHEGLPQGVLNTHVTPKPVALMEYLVGLVTRPGSVVLDPYCGGGSTLMAAKRLRCRYVGVDVNAEYVEVSRHRVGEVVVCPPRPSAPAEAALSEDGW